MPRLVTFGCSYTFGHGLPDVVDSKTPSKYAWPNVLAKKLNYECLNLAVPGSGNREILFKILNTKFLKDDLVLISYSYFSRFNCLVNLDKLNNFKRVDYNSPEFKTLFYSNSDLFDAKMFYDNWLTIQHAELYLESLNIKQMSFLGIDYNSRENKCDLVKLKYFNENVRFIMEDLALDNSHPGIRSHELHANQMHYIITEDERQLLLQKTLDSLPNL